jgi:hypothetical protein
VRRRRPVGPGVPEELARFVPSEWPSACQHEALWAWYCACLDWLAADSARSPKPGQDEHSARLWLSGGSRRVLPFGEHGGGLDVLRELRRYRRAMGPCPRESADAPAG